MLEVSLMGAFSAHLRVNGCVRELALSRRTTELLALLALSAGRFLQRSELVQMVGVSATGDTSPEAVSTALWRLRKTLERAPAHRGDFIVTNSLGAVGMCGSAPWSLDVSAFEKVARAGLASMTPDHAQIEALRAAPGLYKDSLLPGFNAEWILRERERLRRLYLDVLYRLMQVDAAAGNHPGAIHSAQIILALDDIREDVHRALMRYLMLNGQRALALRQFEICRAALKREFAILPMPETIGLYHEINDMATRLPNAVDAQTQRAVTPRSAALHLAAAHEHIAQAESHLRQTIELVDR